MTTKNDLAVASDETLPTEKKSEARSNSPGEIVRAIFRWEASGVLVALIVLCVILALASPNFLTSFNLPDVKGFGIASLASHPGNGGVRYGHRVDQWFFCRSLQTESVYRDPRDVGNLRGNDFSHYQRLSDPTLGSGLYHVRSRSNLWNSGTGSAVSYLCHGSGVGFD